MSLRPERNLIFPFTSNESVGFVVPMPTEPLAVMTKGVASGLALSSTTRALPVPS